MEHEQCDLVELEPMDRLRKKAKDRRARQAYLAFTRKEKCIFLNIALLIIVGLCILFWYLEHKAIAPLGALLPTSKTGESYTQAPLTVAKVGTLSPHHQLHREGYRNNTFLLLLEESRQVYNLTDCWICGQFPHDSTFGHKWYVVPLNKEADVNCSSLYAQLVLPFTTPNCTTHPIGRPLFSMYNKTVHDLGFQPPRFPVANLPSRIPICFSNNGSQAVGMSQNCNVTYEVRDFFRPSFVDSEYYFVCGNSAYPWLPKDWGGVCYVGHVLPPVHVMTRPAARKHLRRARSVNQDDTALQRFTDVAKGLFPLVGATLNSGELRRLSRILEVVINKTAAIEGKITMEMQAIRLTALQNRIVLDMLLIKSGGVCKTIGSSCCVFVPDNAPNIYEGIKDLYDISGSIHYENGPGESWWMSLLKSWGWKLLVPILVVIGLLVAFCLCVNCFPLCISMCMQCCVSAAAGLRPKPIDGNKTNAAIMMRVAEDEHLRMFTYGEDTGRFDVEYKAGFAVAKGSTGDEENQVKQPF